MYSCRRFVISGTISGNIKGKPDNAPFWDLG
jgi:hypothetical protein